MSKIYIVGLGPGNPDQMTFQARAALDKADILCGYPVYLDLIKGLYPEKETIATGMKREIERCQKALEAALAGKTVALVCSGDAGVYGMASPLLELAAEHPEVEVEVVAGVTAALSGGAVLGAPLGHDLCLISLSDLLTPWGVIERRLQAAAMGDFIVCLYNPSSHKRADYLQKACDILLTSGKAPETVCGLVRNIGRDGQSYETLPLNQLRDTQVDMFTTVFVGSATTKALNGRMVTPPGVSQVTDFVIFSGTTEGRMLSAALADFGASVTVCVATDYGREEQGEIPGVTVHTGRMEATEMSALIKDTSACIDATHPYAAVASGNIRAACEMAQTPYLRLLRGESELPEGCLRVDTAAEAVDFLKQTEGNILLATGAKELPQYGVLGLRLFPRVLPSVESIRACMDAGVPRANIIAMQGPFSRELNEALMRQFHIQYMVTKDGGAAGGFTEKMEAALACHVIPVVISRPADRGESYETVLQTCREMMKCR